MRPVHTAKLLKARLGALRDRLTSRTPRLNSDDTLFVGGQFWMSRTIIKLCKRAAARGANLIVLFHDLIPITNPQFTGHDFADEYREVLRLPAHFILTTAFNASELEAARKEMGVGPPAAVSIVPLAEEFPGAQRNEHVLLPPRQVEKLAGRPFVLCVGTVEVRKNHMALLSVWEELEAEFGDSLPNLVVAGRRGWKAEAVLRRLDDVASDGRIIFAEAPSDAALRWLYSTCLFTIFPSFFEGWGLPVGESLWFGKPCAASNTSSIPHVGRDLCLYFSPDDPAQIKQAIRRASIPKSADPLRPRSKPPGCGPGPRSRATSNA
ncbi:MAG TPA: glycosyltransferase family 1 protein [Methylovirgula sp.]|nr:glycosyltransferase family 1 protein [Methylovirgula sp.]